MICDLAETYHVFNYRELPVQTLATLVTGLGQDSRVVRKMSGIDNIPLNTRILAMIYDQLNVSNYIQMKKVSGKKKVREPESLYSKLTEKPKENKDKPIAFISGDMFDKARERLINRIKEKQKGGS